jgi:hypothetical protein
MLYIAGSDCARRSVSAFCCAASIPPEGTSACLFGFGKPVDFPKNHYLHDAESVRFCIGRPSRFDGGHISFSVRMDK